MSEAERVEQPRIEPVDVPLPWPSAAIALASTAAEVEIAAGVLRLGVDAGAWVTPLIKPV